MHNDPYAPLRAFAAPAQGTASLPRTAAGLALTIAVSIALMQVLYRGLERFLSLDGYDAAITAMNSGETGILTVLFSFVTLLIGIMAAADIVHKRSPLTLIGPRRAARAQFRHVVLALLALNVALWLLPPYGSDDLAMQVTPMREWLGWVPLALLALLIQTGTEEVLFRGYLLQQLAARFSHPAAWMVGQSAFFAALHYDPAYGAGAIWIVGGAMLFGLAASDLTARTGTLGPAIALHFINNISAILIVSADETLNALALFKIEVDFTDPAQLLPLMAYDAGLVLCSWLAARIALRR